MHPCYGMAPSLGRSQSRPLKRNRYISGYGKVLPRPWNGAEGFLCLGMGDIMLIHPYILFLFTVPHLSSESLFAPSGEFALRVVSLGI